jgi:hypothetical protein
MSMLITNIGELVTNDPDASDLLQLWIVYDDGVVELLERPA